MVGPFLAGVGVLLLQAPTPPRGDPDSEEEAEDDDAAVEEEEAAAAAAVDDFCLFRLFLEGDELRCL